MRRPEQDDKARRTLRDPYDDRRESSAHPAGADAAVRRRMPEFVRLFRTQGARVTRLASR